MQCCNPIKNGVPKIQNRRTSGSINGCALVPHKGKRNNCHKKQYRNIKYFLPFSVSGASVSASGSNPIPEPRAVKGELPVELVTVLGVAPSTSITSVILSVNSRSVRKSIAAHSNFLSAVEFNMRTFFCDLKVRLMPTTFYPFRFMSEQRTCYVGMKSQGVTVRLKLYCGF